MDSKFHAALGTFDLGQLLNAGLRHQERVEHVVDGDMLLDRDAFMGGALLTKVPFTFFTFDQIGQVNSGGLFLALLAEHIPGTRLNRPLSADSILDP